MTDSFKKYILSKSVGATSISIRKPMLQKFPIIKVQQLVTVVVVLFFACGKLGGKLGGKLSEGV
jgi:type I restriction enzyme S subunit